MLVFISTGDSYGQVVFPSFVISILVIQTKSKQIWFLLHKSKKKKPCFTELMSHLETLKEPLLLKARCH